MALGRWDPAVASPRPRLTLDRLAAASSSLAAAAGGTGGDELWWRRTTTEEGLPVRAWGLEKRGGHPGEVGAAVGPRNQRTAWLLRWICGSGNGFLLSPCLAQQGRKEKNAEEGRGRIERAGENMAQVRLSCTWGEVATGADTGDHAARAFCMVGHGRALLQQFKI